MTGSTAVMRLRSRHGLIDMGWRWMPRLTPVTTLADRKRRERLGQAIAEHLTKAVMGMTTEETR